MGRNLPKPRVCENCGKHFETPFKKKACSEECRKVIAYNSACARWKRDGGGKGECSVCGKPTSYSRKKTCSKECHAILLKNWNKGITRNKWGGAWAKYSAPNQFDFEHMLDILHRKGYTIGDPDKEKYSYRITEGMDIEWWDLKPSPTSHDGQACAGKEQQANLIRVEQEGREESSYKSTLEELHSSFKDWLTSAESTMGQEESYWVC